MPTVEDISKILTNMDSERYKAAVSYIYYLAEIPVSTVIPAQKENSRRDRQIEFVKRTAGKTKVDAKAIEEIRMRSMI